MVKATLRVASVPPELASYLIRTNLAGKALSSRRLVSAALIAAVAVVLTHSDSLLETWIKIFPLGEPVLLFTQVNEQLFIPEASIVSPVTSEASVVAAM